jgi:2-oxo-4-hydroxy-4-carboxy--5-ureidoimidazoline (OHCU) decarboxylase
MTAHETLKELAKARGISVRTAFRYHAAGIDLGDRRAVEEHMFAQRSRKGISKFFHRTALVAHQAVAVAPQQNLEDLVEDLESRLCGVHSELEFLLKHHPGLASELTDAFLYTSEVVERIGAQE